MISVNTGTKGTFDSTRIIRVSVLSGLAGKKLHGHIFSDIKMQRSND